MNNYIISENKRSNELELRYTTSPCFRIFTQQSSSSAGILRTFTNENDIKYILYPIDNDVSREVFSQIIDDNPLFPFCSIKTGQDITNAITQGSIRVLNENIGEGNNEQITLTDVVTGWNERKMFLVIEVCPTEYPNGLPINIIANVLFTVRNINSASNYFSDSALARYTRKGVHPFFVYLDATLFFLKNEHNMDEGGLGNDCQYVTVSYESDNICRNTFGIRSYQAMQEFFRNPATFDKHPLDNDRYFITQGGYLRDNEFRNTFVRTIDGGAIQETMSDAMSFVKGDSPIIYPRVFRKRYLLALINRLHGVEIFRGGLNTQEPGLAVGSTVYLRTGQIPPSQGSMTAPLFTFDLLIPAKSVISDIDISRPECVRLETGVYVLPEALSLTPTTTDESFTGRFVSYNGERCFAYYKSYDGYSLLRLGKCRDWRTAKLQLPRDPSKGLQALSNLRMIGLPSDCRFEGISHGALTLVD